MESKRRLSARREHGTNDRACQSKDRGASHGAPRTIAFFQKALSRNHTREKRVVRRILAIRLTAIRHRKEPGVASR